MADPAPGGQASFIVRTKLYRQLVQGVPTDFAFNSYLDRVLLFVTQTGTSGTIIAARQEPSFNGSVTFTTSVLIGKREEPLLTLCARRIVETACEAGNNKPMIICLALKDHSMETIKAITLIVAANNCWSA